MTDSSNDHKRVRLSFISNNFIRGIIKKSHFRITRRYYRLRYLKCGKYVDFGYRFRFSIKKPYKAVIGDNIFIEEFNVWNAQLGDIIVGSNCLFGLHNIIMGPVTIGDRLNTGPNVSILGPRHAVYGYDLIDDKRTIIGNNVWISTGSIIFPGITIGDNVIIGPGSVVTKDVPKDAFFLGNPARDMSKAFKFDSEQSQQN
ncbi:MAG: DapH/DapD/GlmU-related protein [Spirochaetota bacterium]|nr:DapH/DapD/GlmU-related protein [Spirochaetota bacterium]